MQFHMLYQVQNCFTSSSSSFAKHRSKESSMASNSTLVQSSSHNQGKEVCRYVGSIREKRKTLDFLRFFSKDIFFRMFVDLVINAFILTIDRRALQITSVDFIYKANVITEIDAGRKSKTKSR